MLNRTVKTAVTAAVTLLFFTACAPAAVSDLPSPTTVYYSEAYINEAPPSHTAVTKPAPDPVSIPAYPDTTAAPVAAPAAASAAAPAGQTEALSLVEVKYPTQTLYRINDTNWLTDDVRSSYDSTTIALTRTADRLEALRQTHPGVKFYNYYITRIRDCDWFGDAARVYNYVTFYRSLIADSGIAFSQFALPDMEYYRETGYKTDFHINYKGSDKVYGDVYDMLSADFSLSERKMPQKELDFDNLLIIGDYINEQTYASKEFTDDEMDVFRAYQYDIPPYVSYVDDKQMILGLEEEYAAGNVDRNPRAGQQFMYYGGQTGIVRFEFHQPDKPNLLMVSDSQGRPSRVCIASHFNTTVYIDNVQWRDENVDVDKLIQDYDIDAVLLIGQRSMFELYEKVSNE